MPVPRDTLDDAPRASSPHPPAQDGHGATAAAAGDLRAEDSPLGPFSAARSDQQVGLVAASRSRYRPRATGASARPAACAVLA